MILGQPPGVPLQLGQEAAKHFSVRFLGTRARDRRRLHSHSSVAAEGAWPRATVTATATARGLCTATSRRLCSRNAAAMRVRRSRRSLNTANGTTTWSDLKALGPT